MTVTVTPVFSDAVEGPETATFTIEGSTVNVTIADEPAVTLTAPDASAAELGPNTASLTFTRGGPATYARDVQVSASGTAGNGPDYTLSSPGRISDGRLVLHGSDPGRADVGDRDADADLRRRRGRT